MADRVLVELCAGTAAVSLRALGGPAAPGPLCGFMGGKRRWAGLLAALLGFGAHRPDRVVLVDAGPWGDAWQTLSTPRGRAHTIVNLLEWAGGRLGPNELWQQLASEPPSEDPGERCAQFLWIQARAANCIPVWWDGGRWTSPSGSKAGGRCKLVADAVPMRDARLVEQASPRTMAAGNPKNRAQGRGKGIVSPATIAKRIRRLEALDWSRISVVHGLVEDVEPIPGASVYFDPPYHRAPRYAELLPRDSVLELAERHRVAGCRVLISEAEALPLEGWHHARLPGTDREVLTGSWPIEVARSEQLTLEGFMPMAAV